MKPQIRILALTAALSALAPAAFAAQVELNFNNEFGAVNTPVAVGALQGLQFNGAFGYGAGMLNNQDDPEFLANASGGRGGFILNRQRGQDPSDIIITLAQSAAGNTARTTAAAPDIFFRSITLNLWTLGAGNSNQLIATGDGVTESINLTSSNGGQSWTSTPTFTFSAQNITSLRFTAGRAPFALDDMAITLSNATDPGGNVPEPASYGLVGLALLAAGAASRRKQRS